MYLKSCTMLTGGRALRLLLAGSVVCAPDFTAAQSAQSAQSADAISDVRGTANTNPESTRIDVSLAERMLWVLSGNDTLRSAPIAVATDRELRFGNRSWRFHTPLGRHVVLSKRADPVWRPPDWHYAEAALDNGWKMKPLPAAGVTLPDGRRVLMRDSIAGLILPGKQQFLPLPVNEHIVFDSTLYIPPLGSRNREIVGELGHFALYIGDGYLLHGTPDQSSVGNAVTHGCLRLLDDDIAWLFEHVPVGAVVTIR